MSTGLHRILFAAVIAVTGASIAASGFAESGAARWFLPQRIDDRTVKIRFTVDSTWHTVHGTTSGILGHVRLADDDDLGTIEFAVTIPASRLDTDNESRDEKLREILASDRFPAITIESAGTPLHCTPAIVLERGACSDRLSVKLRVRDVTRELDLPVAVTGDFRGFAVTGSTILRWADYGVVDPSLFLVASVDPEVTVDFTLCLGDAAACDEAAGD